MESLTRIQRTPISGTRIKSQDCSRHEILFLSNCKKIRRRQPQNDVNTYWKMQAPYYVKLTSLLNKNIFCLINLSHIYISKNDDHVF